MLGLWEMIVLGVMYIFGMCRGELMSSISCFDFYMCGMTMTDLDSSATQLISYYIFW